MRHSEMVVAIITAAILVLVVWLLCKEMALVVWALTWFITLF